MSTSEQLEKEAVSAQLSTLRYGRSLRILSVTDSTNDDARLDAVAGAPDGHAVVADAQLRGRGSHGRSWSSPLGQDLYLSIVDRPRVSFAELPPLTLAVGLGVAEAVDQLLDSDGSRRALVKWPNDVLVAGKKCAGVLIEASATGSQLEAVVIGIGVNVNRASFAPGLEELATSLHLAHGERARLDRVRALCAVLASVERWVDRFTSAGPAAIAAALEERLALRGERARCGDVVGIVHGVASSGALRMQTDAGGVRELIAGRLVRE